MPLQELYLIRHGETEWNAEGRFQGALDSPLTDTGRSQARLCGKRLASQVHRIDAFHASPLGRTRETTAIVRTFGPYPDTVWEPRLTEVSLGSWDGLTHIDLEACWPERLEGTTPYDWYFRSPDGESYEAAFARIDNWLSELNGVVVAVTHGLLGRLIRGAYLGLAREAALCLPVPQDVIWRMSDGAIEAITD